MIFISDCKIILLETEEDEITDLIRYKDYCEVKSKVINFDDRSNEYK